MKILIRISIWKRPEITEVCLSGVLRLMLYSLHDIKCLCFGSEKWAKDMVERYGKLAPFEFEFVENYPLGRKLNTGLDLALKRDWDYMMELGSDNLVSNKLLDLYENYYGIDLFGCDKVHFVKKGKAKLVNYNLTLMGAGRMHKRDMIERIATNVHRVEFLQGVASKCWTYNKGDIVYMKATDAMYHQRCGHCHIISIGHVHLWDEHLSNGLDGNATTKMIFHGATNQVVPVPIYEKDVEIVERFPYVVDIKSDVNIWKYEDLEGEKADYNLVLNEFPELNDFFRTTKRQRNILHSVS